MIKSYNDNNAQTSKYVEFREKRVERNGRDICKYDIIKYGWTIIQKECKEK